MEVMPIALALEKRNLLREKIKDAIARAHLVALKKTESDVVYGLPDVTVEQFSNEAKEEWQNIVDLIDLYKRLDAAILLSNATLKITVAGEEMTIAAALNLKRAIDANKCNKNNFEMMLIEVMNAQMKLAEERINKADEGDESATLTLVDPICIREELSKLQERQDKLKAELDNAIKISNETEFIAF